MLNCKIIGNKIDVLVIFVGAQYMFIEWMDKHLDE